MSEPVIRTEDLSRDYGIKRAVDCVSMEVPAGRVVALLGPNGAGKSTWLRLVHGLIEPTEGGAWLFGAPSRALPAEVCGRVAAMHERHEPPPWATARRLFDLQAGASPKFDRAAAERLADARDLKPNADYGSLSKGQRRWLLASVTLATGADLLLMDEPADGLDTAARRDLYDHLRDYANEREATVVVATHIIHDVERVADDVAIIHRGRMMLHESIEDLREQVREIELPEGGALPAAGNGFGVLGTKKVPGASLVWVRCAGGEESIRERVADKATLRTVGLELLYLILTGHETDPAGIEGGGEND